MISCDRCGAKAPEKKYVSFGTFDFKADLCLQCWERAQGLVKDFLADNVKE